MSHLPNDWKNTEKDEWIKYGWGLKNADVCVDNSGYHARSTLFNSYLLLYCLCKLYDCYETFQLCITSVTDFTVTCNSTLVYQMDYFMIGLFERFLLCTRWIQLKTNSFATFTSLFAILLASCIEVVPTHKHATWSNVSHCICFLDETPSIEHSSQATFLNRSANSSICLECQIRGQPGMIVAWEGNGVKSTSPNPQTLNTFGVVKTTMTVTYVNDELVFHHCIKSSNNSRKFHCKLYYNCTAKYPRATILSRKTIPVIITPDIGEFFFCCEEKI